MAPDLESAKVKARSLFDTLNMPQNPDGQTGPHKFLRTSGKDVGLPDGRTSQSNGDIGRI